MCPDPKIDLINEFADCYLSDAKLDIRSSKVIHECIWGTQPYKKYEIVLLDAPLLQRLRDIRQTGLGYLTFPTASHSRFDHTLGTITQCTKFADVLSTKKSDLIGPEDTKRLRLAALLHDIGHCFFSHTSEEVYGLLPEMQSERVAGARFEHNAPHEILTVKVLNTKAFQDFFSKVITKYEIDCTLEQIITLVTGTENRLSKYKSDILNGPFDADKIDYLFRDSRFSGIPLVIDLDRMWYATDIEIINIGGEDLRRLVIDYTGTSPLEEILFDRVQLYPSLYNHQKVRASDCMFKGIIEYIQEKSADGVRICRRDKVKFDTLVDFLWGSELDFYALGTQTNDDTLHKFIHDLRYRRLLKRIMVISRNTVEVDEGYKKFLSFRHPYNPTLYKELRDAARAIYEEAKKKGIECNLEQIWIDLPTPPKVSRDIDRAYVILPDKKLIPLSEIFPIKQWLELYELHKWQGFVFVPDGIEKNAEMRAIVKDVLEKIFKLNIKKEAFLTCHLEYP